MTSEKERSAIVAFICRKALDDTPPQLTEATPRWRRFIWGMLHPVRFEAELTRMTMALDLAKSIRRGDHMKGQPDV